MRQIAAIGAGGEGTTVQGSEGDEPGRRNQIVRAAAAVLGRQGYAETSLKDVAREARVAPGLLHYYFDSKEELLLQVVMVTERQMVANWKAVPWTLWHRPTVRMVLAREIAQQFMAMGFV